jgi:hypothetical protein
MNVQHTKAVLGSLLLAAIMATGCGDSTSTTRYSPAVRSNFMGACEQSGGTERDCEKALECLEGRLNEEEFRDAEAALANGNGSDSLAAAVDACT